MESEISDKPSSPKLIKQISPAVVAKVEEKKFKSLDQTITDNFMKISTTYEGRDKIVKFFQYLAKFMSWHVLRDNRDSPAPKDLMEQSLLYLSISRQLYDARSIFRLFKSLFEIKRIQIILKCIKDTDQFTLITNVVSRSCYFMHWLFDNIYILTKIMNVQIKNG